MYRYWDLQHVSAGSFGSTIGYWRNIVELTIVYYAGINHKRVIYKIWIEREIFGFGRGNGQGCISVGGFCGFFYSRETRKDVFFFHMD